MNTIRTIMNTIRPKVWQHALRSAYVSFTLSRGIPRYVPRYLNEYRGIPRYNFFRGTHHYKTVTAGCSTLRNMPCWNTDVY